jgi:hypothetical protein
MLRVHLPQRTLFPGLGVAGAVLAAVILAFMSTGAIVAFNLLSSDPQGDPSAPIVLTGPASSAPMRTPRAHPRPPVAPRKPVAPAASSVSTATAPAPVQRRIPTAHFIREEPPAPPKTPEPPPPPPQQAPASAPAAPRPAPLAPVGDVVVQATSGVANTLRSATTDLGNAVVPLSPPVGEAVAAVGQLVGDTVDATGNLVGGLLRPSAPA